MIRVRMRGWNSRIFLILPAAFFLVLQNASSLCAQPAMYGTGQWDRRVSREFADMEFEPSTGKGRYLV